MSVPENALPLGGPAKPTQNPGNRCEIIPRDRCVLALTLCFCLLLADTLLWYGPTAGLTAAVFFWYVLVLAALGAARLRLRENQVLLAANLFLAASLALGSSWYFRVWDLLALLVLLPLHAISLAGAARLPWHRPIMLWERLGLLLQGLFGNLGAAFAALTPQRETTRSARLLPAVLGTLAAAALLLFLVPLLSSADALFAAATRSLSDFVEAHLTEGLWKTVIALVLTPFLFGLLVRLRRPVPAKPLAVKALSADGLLFAIILTALVGVYLVFLTIQSAGLFGGADYLAARGISYADWARSGFFQMVGVTMLNLTVTLAALVFSRREGRAWTAVRLLAALLTAESLVLLLSAAWRMTLYVSAYGLSFKRLLTYWGMVMMALFFLLAAGKVQNPDRSFWRAAAPVALAGWLVLHCIPVDHLVAKDQVDRYLSGSSAAIDVEYLLYDLSYDAVSQLERLDGQMRVYGPDGTWRTLDSLLEARRAAAQAECGRWQTWSLSACLAYM